MGKSITFRDMRQSGRIYGKPSNLPEIFFTKELDFSSAETYEINLSDINQTLQFGMVESIYIDNTDNPSEVQVSVSGTNQFFTVPAYAQGFFTVSANVESVISLYSDGGATDISAVAIYNKQVPPIVWYKYGASNNDTPSKVYGPLAPGDLVAAKSFNTPVFIGAIDGTGNFRAVKCDASGNLTMSGTITISSISIADGSDVALGATTSAVITNPATNGTLISYTRGILTGIGQAADAAVTNPASSASIIASIKGVLTGIGQVADAAVTNPASSASLIASLKGILTGINNLFNWRTSGTGTNTSVAAAVANTALLAVNANRKGATVYNDSATAYLNIALGFNASATAFAAKVSPGGYYEIPFGFTGAVNGYWDAAVGNARIVEFS